MIEAIEMAGRCHWAEKGKWMRATVPEAIYKPAEGKFSADYKFDGVRGHLEVKGAIEGGGSLTGSWSEKSSGETWAGGAQLTHTSGAQKHLFIGTWSGESGPGEFIFDLDEVQS